jgi:ferrous iron transport protein B
MPATLTTHSTQRSTLVVLGLESVGKTQLIGSLTGVIPSPENFRGSTLACERYADGGLCWMDTPGIFRESETETTRTTMASLTGADLVVLVARAGSAANELETLLPLAAGKRGFVILTFADRLLSHSDTESAVRALSGTLGVPVFAVDARRLTEGAARSIRQAASAPDVARFPENPPPLLPSILSDKEHHPHLIERIASNPIAALALLFLPAAIAVVNANRFADWLYEPLGGILEPLLARIGTWPGLGRDCSPL